MGQVSAAVHVPAQQMDPVAHCCPPHNNGQTESSAPPGCTFEMQLVPQHSCSPLHTAASPVCEVHELRTHWTLAGTHCCSQHCSVPLAHATVPHNGAGQTSVNVSGLVLATFVTHAPAQHIDRPPQVVAAAPDVDTHCVATHATDVGTQ